MVWAALALAAQATSLNRRPQSIQKSSPRIDKGTFGLDTAAVHALYMDGEFESAIQWLENARKNNWIKTHGDSVFVYKHLGVMYAASYETMEKGKQFMYKLLTIEPSVRILDMYASDMIYMIFRNVQSEFEIKHARIKNDDSTPLTAKDTLQNKSKPKISRKPTWPYWTGAALVTAGIGLTAFFVLHEGHSKTTSYEGGL